MNDVFPNWNIQARMEYSIKRNGVDFVTLRGGWANLIWEISYKQFRIVLCQMAFVYAIIYYIFPLYISNKKKWITTGKLLLLFIAFLGLHYWVTYVNVIDGRSDYRVGNRSAISQKNPSFATVSRLVKMHIVFNLSTIVGLAVAIKLLKRWWLKQRETELAAKEKISAELQLLKAQIHPHFLFNSLNNIYSFALEASPRAPQMIQKLSSLLHYMLYECKHPKVPLAKELNMISDYISLEKIRYGERLKIDIQFPRDIDHQMIAPLLLIPFVENSFKHGTSKMLSKPYVRLNIMLDGNMLYFKLTNSRPESIDEMPVNPNRGLGLKNVKKRLELLYPKNHELQTMEDPSEYSVWMKIDMGNGKSIIKKEERAYELA